MNVPIILSVILFLLMLVIGRGKGVRSFLSLFLNFIVMLLIIVLMTNVEYNPIILTMIACILVSCINLFFINEVNQKTVTAFIATMITTGILLVFIYYITKVAMIQGFGEEEIDEIVSVYSIEVGVDFLKLATAVIILSTVAAIVDVSISITSPMAEIYKHHPEITRKELFKSGVTIGKDILGSNANTLFFAFIGGYLALLLWFKDLSYSFSQIVNSKIFASEMMMIFFAGIGIALVIPIAAFINAYYLTKSKKETDSRVQ
ncbi:MAG TPA: YibE/F family protein [Pseudogracilibacillus sp.]|nr:YibE/F family protein [Pseudogracilibacillus sp.]